MLNSSSHISLGNPMEKQQQKLEWKEGKEDEE